MGTGYARFLIVCAAVLVVLAACPACAQQAKGSPTEFEGDVAVAGALSVGGGGGGGYTLDVNGTARATGQLSAASLNVGGNAVTTGEQSVGTLKIGGVQLSAASPMNIVGIRSAFTTNGTPGNVLVDLKGWGKAQTTSKDDEFEILCTTKDPRWRLHWSVCLVGPPGMTPRYSGGSLDYRPLHSRVVVHVPKDGCRYSILLAGTSPGPPLSGCAAWAEGIYTSHNFIGVSFSGSP